MDTSGDENSAEDEDSEGKDEGDGEDEAERIQREELIGKVMPWFMDQLNQYSDEEQKAIKVCAIEFVNDGKIPSPSVKKEKNALYSQQRIMELCSAFVLMDKDRSDCAKFAKTVFATTFYNTEISTLEKKIKGRDKMQILLDSYWEAVLKKKY